MVCGESTVKIILIIPVAVAVNILRYAETTGKTVVYLRNRYIAVVVKKARLNICREPLGKYALCLLAVLLAPFFNKLLALGITGIVRSVLSVEIENQYIPLFREHLGSDFIYEGVVSGDKKDIYYKSLDIFILPSFFEGLPMSLLESMSYGIVPITTKVGSIETVIKDGINGLYIEVKDSVSIEDKFLVLNANRDFLYAMSQAAHKTIIDHFNPNQYIAELNVIYEKLKKSYIRKI